VRRRGRPSLVVLAGPNRAGKSTLAPRLLKGALGVSEFVDADVIARGISGFEPERAAFAAGRVMLARVRALAEQRASFGFETTLASRSFAPWLANLKSAGYAVHLVFLSLPAPDMAVRRVAERVRMGGHSVPEVTVVRRYRTGLQNFFRLYRRLATTWRVYDNAGKTGPRLIAGGRGDVVTRVSDLAAWERLQARASR
jgi:predicted ABC-type ATPase